MPNNAQLLNTILLNQENERKERKEWQKSQDIRFFNLSAEFSDYKNKQEPLNQKLLGYLESDKSTNQKGVVEQVGINKQEIECIKTNDKVRAGKIAVVSAIGTAAIFVAKHVFFE